MDPVGGVRESPPSQSQSQRRQSPTHTGGQHQQGLQSPQHGQQSQQVQQRNSQQAGGSHNQLAVAGLVEEDLLHSSLYSQGTIFF